MLLTSLALAVSVQAAGDSAVAIKNDNPETWVVEYPRVIRPFVAEYRQCLNVSNRRVTGEANFEVQHRSDLPRCAKIKDASIAKSNAAMVDAKTQIGTQEVDQLFTNIGLIHVARGRDLDDQFRRSVVAVETVRDDFFEEQEERRGLVLELRDATVVKSRAEVEAASPASSKVE